MKENYFKSIVMIERLHRLFLEVMKVELDRMKIRDINNVQFVILYNLAREKVMIGDLTNHSYYLGTNASYNLRKMIQNGYVVKEKRSCDGRSSLVYLSNKGIKLYEKLDELFEMHSKALFDHGFEKREISDLRDKHLSLEEFWENLIRRENS